MEPTDAEGLDLTRTPDSEPIPGYRLIDLLGRGGFGEVWRCEAPGGLFKAIKFVYGNTDVGSGDRAPAEEELRAIEHVKGIRHPFLLSMERVERLGSELLIVMELADRSLHDLFAEYRQAGQAGIPREELLSYLREAAEALDLMNHRHGLQHLDVKPRNLFLVSNHVKVADFGLVNSLGTLHGHGTPKVQLGAITPLYASPEVFQGAISPHSDQYSLAIVYQELLTGTLPFRGKNARQLLLQHVKGQPDLAALPPGDQPIVARALAKDARQRFACCTEFVQALASGDAPLLPATLVRNRADVPSLGDPTGAPLEPAGVPAGGGDALPGYQFLECLGCSPAGEVWKVCAPDGRKRLVKFLYGFGAATGREGEAVVRLQSLNYPALAVLEVVKNDPGRLVLAADYVKKSLWTRFQECQAQGLPGIPAAELRGYVRTAAEALDYLYEQHAVQHLDLNPRNLLLADGRLLIGDFGLVQLLWLPAGQPLPGRKGGYIAPEVLRNQVGTGCDQYSLAVIYAELVGGKHPWRGRPAGQPDLDALAAGERAVVLRALDRDPRKRWPTVSDFVRALEEAAGGPADTEGAVAPPAIVTNAPVAPLPAQRPPSVCGRADQIVSDLVAARAKTSTPRPRSVALPLPADGEVLLRRFNAPLPIGAARLKLESFRQRCNGRLLREDAETFSFVVIRPRNFWQQCTGRQPGLEVGIHLDRPGTAAATPIAVTVQLRPFGCGRKHGARLLQEFGPLLMESLRSCLQVSSERRAQERMLWQHRLRIQPVLGEGGLGEQVECQGKDISQNGVGFYLPRALPTTLILVELPSTTSGIPIWAPATIVRVQHRGDGWFEVGALFVQETAAAQRAAGS
jgi:serine/threonine protein kinase